MFDVRYDAARSLVLATMTGLWSVDDVDRYGAALATALGPSIAAGKPVGLLVDSRSYPVQTAEVSARFTAMLARWPAQATTPLVGFAIVAGSTLNKLQARRIFGDTAMVFLDHGAACDWIAGELDRAAR